MKTLKLVRDNGKDDNIDRANFELHCRGGRTVVQSTQHNHVPRFHSINIFYERSLFFRTPSTAVDITSFRDLLTADK